MIKSSKIYSPQKFLEAATGKVYTITFDEPIVNQIERILIHHKKPYSSYPLEDAQKAFGKDNIPSQISNALYKDKHLIKELENYINKL